jgi:hypothetical protein
MSHFRSWAINSANTVSYYGVTDSKGRGIYLNNGGHQTMIAERNGVFQGVGYHTSINDDGLVAFEGRKHDGTCGIFVGNGDEINRVLSQGDRLDGRAVKRIHHEFTINNQGAIALIAEFEDDSDEQRQRDKALYLATPVSK